MKPIFSVTWKCAILWGLLPWREPVGAGGLGDLAIRCGYLPFNTPVMVAVIIGLMGLMALIQGLATGWRGASIIAEPKGMQERALASIVQPEWTAAASPLSILARRRAMFERTLFRRTVVFGLFSFAALPILESQVCAAAEQPGQSLEALVSGPQRSAANKARDPYRHPLEDLRFLGIMPSDTVVEILPGGGAYWTEILAPYLRNQGHYVAANPPKTDTSDEAVKGNATFAAKVAGDPADFAKVQVTDFAPPQDLVPPGTADAVLTFRNVHNWMADGTVDAVFASFFRALKPGGILGIEEHRGRADQPQDPKAKSGYVRQDAVIGFAEQAGFKLAASSEANANPKDSKDYPEGVWTLPPAYRLKDKDHDRYAAIGESDRMLLKFVKPGP